LFSRLHPSFFFSNHKEGLRTSVNLPSLGFALWGWNVAVSFYHSPDTPFPPQKFVFLIRALFFSSCEAHPCKPNLGEPVNTRYGVRKRRRCRLLQSSHVFLSFFLEASRQVKTHRPPSFGHPSPLTGLHQLRKTLVNPEVRATRTVVKFPFPYCRSKTAALPPPFLREAE